MIPVGHMGNTKELAWELGCKLGELQFLLVSSNLIYLPVQLEETKGTVVNPKPL